MNENVIQISSQNTLDDTLDICSESVSLKHSAEINIERKPSVITENCTGCIFLNLSYGGFQFNKVIEANGNDIDETMHNIKEYIKCFDKYVESFKNQVEESRFASDCSPPNIISTNSKHSCRLEKDSPSFPGSQNQKFKYPRIELSQTVKNRLTSSSSSSNRPSSSIINRYSTTSSNCLSLTSDSNMKTDSEDVISDTSDSEQEQLATTIIHQEEEQEYINVYARWKTDKYFYAGKVKDNSSSEAWEVLFDDGTLESVKCVDILQIDLLPEETEISVDIEGDWNFIRNYIISRHVDVKVNYGKQPVKGYRVYNKMNGLYNTVTRDRASIHIGVARKLKDLHGELNCSFSLISDSGDVSVDNIIAEKRTLKRKRFSQFITMEDLKPKRCASPSIFHLDNLQGSKSAYLGIKNQISKTISSIFTNCYFMITGEKVIENSEIENNSSKEYLEQNIYKHNGCVIEKLTKAHIEQFRNSRCKIILIVIGEVSQTVKFMMTLAVGQVPIVGDKWVDECIQHSKFLEFQPFLLFRGIIEDDKKIYINLSEKRELGIFSDKNILIVTDDISNAGKNWQEILELAGAETFLIGNSFVSPCVSDKFLHFAVIDRDRVTNNCIKKLKNLNIVLLDILYVTRCLILNKLIDYGNYIL